MPRPWTVPGFNVAIPFSPPIYGRGRRGNVFLGGNPPIKGDSMAIRTLALAALLGVAAAAPSARAEDLNLNEKPDTVQASLAPYSLGLGAGAISALNNELSDRSAAFLKLSVIQSLQFTDHMAAGLDL